MANKIRGKTPPYNQEAEISVLGSMLIDKTAIANTFEILKTNDFFAKKHY